MWNGRRSWWEFFEANVFCPKRSVRKCLFCSLGFGGIVGKFSVNGFVLKIMLFPGKVYCKFAMWVDLSICWSNHDLALQLSDGLLHVFICTSWHPCGGGRSFSPAQLPTWNPLPHFSLLPSLLFSCMIIFFLFTSWSKKWITSSPFTDSFNFTLPTYSLFFSFLDASVLYWRVSAVMGKIKWSL